MLKKNICRGCHNFKIISNSFQRKTKNEKQIKKIVYRKKKKLIS